MMAMPPLRCFLFCCLLLLIGIDAPCAGPSNIEELRRAFQEPPPDARIMMRWWWFGPSVTKEGIEREMRLMKEGGIGGFEVQPVYPLALDDPTKNFRNLPFLSAEFLEALRFTSEKARELGMRMDLTLGSGWPYGGPSISITQAAGKLRFEQAKVEPGSKRVALPNLSNGEKLIAIFSARKQGGEIVPDTLREIEPPKGDILWLSESDSFDTILFFISSRTGMMVKRPSVGAEGFVLDHYDRDALNHYLRTIGEPLLKALGPNPPYAIFCDSLEVFGSDWTPDLLEEFRKRRGYDLRPYLPALVTNIGPTTAGIRHDWGKTLTELLEERFLAPMRSWAKEKGALFRIQGYGIPPATISSNFYADLPEGEGHHWKVVRASRWASSASHLYGRPVTSSETWTWLHSPSFRATPLDVKAEADLHFLQGINQLIGHGWPYTPEGVEYPGWRFYAAAVFNHQNPWWIVMPDLSRYLQRLSFLLRQGRPANDVALYLPNSDVWSRFTAGRVHMIEALREHVGSKVIAQILESGYGVDFFDDRSLEQVGRVEKDRLLLGGNPYRIVVLPSVELMPLATLRKLEEFVRGGGILVATRRIPQAPPGFTATSEERGEAAAIVKRLFASPEARGHVVLQEENLGAVLQKLLPPDLRIEPPVAEIGFIRRSTDFAQIYFVANTSNVRHRVKATFRVSGLMPEWWDPVTGGTEPALPFARTASGVTLDLELEPYESKVVVFSKNSRRATPSPGREHGSPIDISTGWDVTFDGNGRKTRMEELKSWTEDIQTRYYSGTASYEKDVTVPADLLKPGQRVRIDFGEGKPVSGPEPKAGMRAWLDGPVRDAAVIYVNGVRAGSVWCPPYSLDITGYLKPGLNRLKIVVANVAVNHMAGRPLPDYKLLNLRYGVRFQPQDMDQIRPVPAGLLGPVRIIAIPGPR